MDDVLRNALFQFGIINWMASYFADDVGIDREEDDIIDLFGNTSTSGVLTVGTTQRMVR